jgi:hypothetical protein
MPVSAYPSPPPYTFYPDLRRNTGRASGVTSPMARLIFHSVQSVTDSIVRIAASQYVPVTINIQPYQRRAERIMSARTLYPLRLYASVPLPLSFYIPEYA